MICRQCAFDLRHVRMQTTWLGDAVRTLSLALECPQCGTSFHLPGEIKEAKFLTIPAPEKSSCLPK